MKSGKTCRIGTDEPEVLTAALQEALTAQSQRRSEIPELRTAASSSTFLVPLFTGNWRMTDDEKYFFDLNGYLVLRDVVDPDTIRRCNEAIDHYDDQIEVHERRFEGESKALTSDIRQRWSDEMVAWERPYCEPFRQLMVHPRLKPYLREIIGDYHMATRHD